MRVSGAILAGGKSQRMGTDKAHLAIGSGSMLDHMVATLRPVVDELAIVGGGHCCTGAHMVAGRYPGQGPLGGVLSGLQACQGDVLVAVSCDLVRLRSDVISVLAGLLDTTGADYVVPLIGGRQQWHCSLWRRRCEVPMQEAFDLGARSFRAATVALIGCTVVLADKEAFDDIDTPEDYTILAQQLTTGTVST